MKYIALLGIVASVINMILHESNDPALWGWMSSAAWASAVFISEIANRNK